MWGDEVVHCAYTFVRDQGRAQDIAQESFLKLYQWRLTHPHREIRIGWLFTITRNLALDDLRRHRWEGSLDSWADEVGVPMEV